jgi:hypothetical protein
MTTPAHDLAGLTHRGGHDRPLAASGWSAPAVVLEDDVLRWSYFGIEDRSASHAEVGPRMLERFLRFADAPAERIAAYAQEYGVLQRPRDGELSAMEGAEPIDWWRTLATEATATLDLAAKIRNPRAEVTVDDWDRFTTLSVEPMGKWWEYQATSYGPLKCAGEGVLDAKQLLSLYVSAWLADVSVGLVWSYAGEAEMDLWPGGLLGALGLQLAQSLARTGGLALSCRGCGQSFSPQHGNQRYCHRCKDLRESQRLATKRYRERLRQ